MYETHPQTMRVKITGPLSAIEQLLEYNAIPDAHRCDLHGIVWIEAPYISVEQEAWVARQNCAVHHTRITPASR